MDEFEQAQPIRVSRTVVGGIETNYYEAGPAEGGPLVLLHGMSSSADSFRELQMALSERYWTLAPDIPGFGDSANTDPYTFPQLVDWLSDFLVSLDTGPAHLVGHSFGGALAVSHALAAPHQAQTLILLAPSVLRPGKYPQWLRRLAQSSVSERILQLGVSHALAAPHQARTLILLAPSVLRPGKYPQWLRRLAQSSVSERILELGVSASRLMLERQMRAAFYDASRFDPSLWERRRRDYERARASAAVLRASALHDIRGDLHNIQQPSCIIWGQQDPVLAPQDAFVLNELMPKSRTYLHLLPQCGHIPHIEQEEQVTAIITEFLEFREDIT